MGHLALVLILIFRYSLKRKKQEREREGCFLSFAPFFFIARTIQIGQPVSHFPFLPLHRDSLVRSGILRVLASPQPSSSLS